MTSGEYAVTQTRSPEAVCAHIAQRIQETVGDHRYRMWFDRTAQLDYEGSEQRLHVTVPNSFVADWIGRKFRDEITMAASEATGNEVDLAVRIAPESFNHACDIRLKRSWSAQAMNLPLRLRSVWSMTMLRLPTLCSFTAAAVWERRIYFRAFVSACSKSIRALAFATSLASSSPTITSRR